MNNHVLDADAITPADSAKFRQCSVCSIPPVLKILSTISGVGIIIHSASGCAASFADIDRSFRFGLKRRGKPLKKAILVNTRLNEMDHVYGAEQKLYTTIVDTIKQHSPKALFVAASCGSGINGCDIQQVAWLAAQKFNIPVIPMVCEVFVTKKWGSGLDFKKYGNFQKIFHPAGSVKNTPFFNVIDFSGSETVKKILNETGFNWNFIAQYEPIDNWSAMGNADLTFCVSTDHLSLFIAEHVALNHGVPYVKLPGFYGFTQSDQCLNTFGQWLSAEDTFANLIKKYHAEYNNSLTKLQRQLRQLEVLPILSNRNDWNKLIPLLSTLGVALPDVDALKFTMGRMSHFKLVKLVNTLKPALIISRHHSYAAQNAMTHCPSIWLGDDCDIAGYPGTIRLGETILEKISNPYFFKRMARYPVHPYKKERTDDYPEKYEHGNKTVMPAGVF